MWYFLRRWGGAAGLAVSFFQAWAQQASSKVYLPVTVGFYNLENLFDTIRDYRINDADFTPQGQRRYNTFIYKDKLAKLSTIIAQMGLEKNKDGLAVLGVAEIENARVLQDLLQQPALKERNWRLVHYDSKDFRGIDVALLYHPKYFQVLAARPVLVPLPSSGQYKTYTRDILWVKGILGASDTFHFFVNHWPSRVGGEARSAPFRNKAAVVVRRIVDSLLQYAPGEKVIVMGDLNDNPNNQSVVKYLKAKGTLKKLRSGELYNPYVSFYEKGIGTLAHQDTWGLFDQMMLSQNLLNQATSGFFFYKAYIVQNPELLERVGQFSGYPKRSFVGAHYNGGYSDHLPVYLLLLKEKGGVKKALK